MARGGFIFGGDTGETQESLRRQREIVRSMMANQRVPRDVGEGIAAIGQALSARMWHNYLNKKEAVGRESAAAAFNPIVAALGRGGDFPAAPSAPGATAAASSPPDNPNVGSTIDFARAEGGKPSKSSGSKDEFIAMIMPAAIEASKRTGIDPRIIVAQAAHESGWGRSAPGNNYFGIKSHGKGGGQTFTTHEVVNGKRLKINDSFRTYGSPSDSVSGYADFMLENPRYRPMREAQGLDAQLAALGASGYATDPNYQRAIGSIARGIQLPDMGAPAPVQVASLDPSAGVASALSPDVTAAGAEQGLPPDHPGLAAIDRMKSGNLPAQPVAPAPIQGGAPLPPEQLPVPAAGFGQMDLPMAQPSGMPVQAPQPSPQVSQALERPSPAPVQVAQAQPMPEMAGNTSDRRSGNIDMGTLIQAAQNPWLSDTQSAIIQALMRQEMARNDPVAQMEQEKMRLELEALRNPKAESFSLSPGEIRFSGDGKEIARGGEKEAELPSAVREYEYARSQGFPGTFQDWEASKKGGMSLNVDPTTGAVTFQQGNNIKPLTEQQSKDTVFATRAEGALFRLEPHADALTNFSDSAGAQIPIIGNYLKSEAYQKAEQAGKEFLQAILRKDTGAAITPQETEEYGSVYLPRPGDKAGVKEQKRQSRKRALEAIKAGMPAQAILAQEKALLATGDNGSSSAPAQDSGDGWQDLGNGIKIRRKQ